MTKRSKKEPPTLIERFWSKVDKKSSKECWPWLGVLNSKGYGCIWYQGRHFYAHRMVMVLAGHFIPRGRVCHHKCGVRNCVNPSHIEITTYSENNKNVNRSYNNGFFGGVPRGMVWSVNDWTVKVL